MTKHSVIRININYLAGFMDGEGCITLVKREGKKKTYSPEHKPTVVVNNCNKNILINIQNSFGGKLYCQKRFEKTNGRMRDVYTLFFYNKDAHTICLKLVKFLVLKRRNAELIIDFYRNKPKKVTYPVSQKELRKKFWRSYTYRTRLNQAIECWKDEIKDLEEIFNWLAVCNKDEYVLQVSKSIKEKIANLEETIKLGEGK
jgi:hypothetical protein